MGKLSRDKRDIFYRKAKDSGYRARSAYKLLQIDDMFNLFGDTQYGQQEQQQKVRSSLEQQQDESLEKNDLRMCGSHGNKSSSSSMIVHRAVDLCAAPGGWSQVLVERMTAVNHKEQNVKQFNQNNADSNDEQEETTQTSSSTTKPAIVAVDLWPIEPISGVHFIRGDITSLDTATSIINFFDGERAEVSACILCGFSCVYLSSIVISNPPIYLFFMKLAKHTHHKNS